MRAVDSELWTVLALPCDILGIKETDLDKEALEDVIEEYHTHVNSRVGREVLALYCDRTAGSNS